MRLLMTSFDARPRLGGVATCAHEIARALSARGDFELRLLAPAQPGDEAFDRHGCFETRRVALSAGAARAVPGMTRALASELWSWRPNAILNTLWLPDGVCSLLSTPMRMPFKIPFFVMAHGVELMESKHTLRKRVRGMFAPMKQTAFEGAAASFAVSRYTANLLKSECGIDPERVIVSFNGVDPEVFTPGPPSADLVAEHGLAGRKVFLTVTRLESYKGVDRAITALPRVLARHPEALLLICGDGPDRARLERLAWQHGVAAQVRFAGAIAPERLVDYYRLADCFVLLSREELEEPNVEGFGLVFLEAAACEKPAIGGRSGGIADAIEDGRSGWLVHPGKDEAIAAAMIRVLENPEEARRVGADARKRVLEGFTWTHVASRIANEIRRHVKA